MQKHGVGNEGFFISMAYDFKTTEKKWKEYWDREKVYEFTFDPAKPVFSVDTPPPYVSADHLHAGHIMSYTQAEFIVRFKRMRGFNVFYPMGFDDNGLPTERFVERKYKIDKSKISRSEFIALCLKETEAGAKTYKHLWTTLGNSVDWTKTYSTISPIATKVSQWSLIDLYKKGALYRAESPILWCTSCRTALAQADLEDMERESKMNYIAFKSPKGKDLLIATTRPELLPACVALYVNPDDIRYKELIGKEAIVPLFEYPVPIKASPAVYPEFGTGLMMVCTWGDQEDLEKWREDKLQTRNLFTEDGRLSDIGGSFAGLKIQEAREAILKALGESGALKRQEAIMQTVNVHERCSTPTEFILSKQWFIKIADLKNTWLKYGKELNWFPKDREQDYIMWVNSLKWDWCISRQRYYGVPLPIWYCAKCNEPTFAEEKDLPVNPLEDKPSQEACSSCGGELVPEKDVMDTWATSSCTPFLIRELAEESAKASLFPATLRPNAFEIIRTWDFYSVVKSHYHFGSLPFRDVMISGHGVDEDGKKFEKRLGNYMPSNELMEKYDADPIRYWATGAMLGQNLKFSTKEIEKGKKTVIKLWNVAKLLEMSLEGFDPNTESAKLEHADAWIISEFNAALEKATTAFEQYAYAKAKDIIDDFFWAKFADYYIEFVKYRLKGEDAASKKATQQTLHNVFLGILKMYAPILPFVTEELYHQRYAVEEGEKTIHLSRWPEAITVSDLDISDFGDAINAIDEVRKYKSTQGLPLGTELEEYTIQGKVNIEKYGSFIQGAIRVKNLLR